MSSHRGKRGVVFYPGGEVYVGQWSSATSQLTATNTCLLPLPLPDPDNSGGSSSSFSGSESSARSQSPLPSSESRERRRSLRQGRKGRSAGSWSLRPGGPALPQRSAGPAPCRQGWGARNSTNRLRTRMVDDLVQLRSRGERYEGQWVDDRAHGLGCLLGVASDGREGSPSLARAKAKRTEAATDRAADQARTCTEARQRGPNLSCSKEVWESQLLTDCELRAATSHHRADTPEASGSLCSTGNDSVSGSVGGFHAEAAADAECNNDSRAAVARSSFRGDKYFGHFLAGKRAKRGVAVSAGGLLWEEVRSSEGKLLRSPALLFSRFQATPSADAATVGGGHSLCKCRAGQKDKTKDTAEEDEEELADDQTWSTDESTSGESCEDKGENAQASNHRIICRSSICAMDSWSTREVSYLASCLGLGTSVAAKLRAHRIDGAAFGTLASPVAVPFLQELFEAETEQEAGESLPSESLGKHGLSEQPQQRLLVLAVEIFLRLRRKLDAPQVFAAELRRRLGGLEIQEGELAFLDVVGEGGFGKVYLAKWKDAVVAAKAFHVRTRGGGKMQILEDADDRRCEECRSRPGLPTRDTETKHGQNPKDKCGNDKQEIPASFYSEMCVLQKLRHPNITQLLGFCLKPQCILVMEYVRGGSLYDVLHVGGWALSSESRDWGFSDVVGTAREICLGMAYLHANDVVHCDLKSQNILIADGAAAASPRGCCLPGQKSRRTASSASGGRVGGSVKICDFGLATQLGPLAPRAYSASASPSPDSASPGGSGHLAELTGEAATRIVNMGCVGTHHWMAPEVLRGEGYSTAADVYSFGMILWEMISRKIPFKDYTALQVVGLVGFARCRPRPPEDCPDPLRVPLRAALRRKPQSRTSFTNLSGIFGRIHHSAVIEVEEGLLLFLAG